MHVFFFSEALPEAQLHLVNLIISENTLKIQKQFQSHGETISVQLNALKKFKEALFGTEAADNLQKVLENNPDLEFVVKILGAQLKAGETCLIILILIILKLF